MASSGATKSQLQEDVLTCLICTEVYTDPCTLTCGHSFCKKCLLKYMKTQPAAIKARHLLCPYCRQTMPVDNHAGALEDWVEELQPTLIMKGLLDMFGAVGAVGQESTKMCFVCLQTSKHVQSTSWCQYCDIKLCDVCARIHVTLPTSSHHVISDLSDEIKVGKRKAICKEHNSVTEFFCKDCNIALCHKCSILNHRKCESIAAIESVLPGITTSLTKSLDTMAGEMTRIKRNLKKREINFENNESHKQSIVLKIAATSRNAVKYIKQEEKRLMEELEEVTKSDTEELTSAMKADQIGLQMYQQYTKFVTNALTSHRVMDMCEMYKRCQSEDVQVSVNNDAVFVNNHEITKLCFVEEVSLPKLMTNVSLGRLVAIDLSTCTPVLQDKIDIRVHGDENNPDPVDVVVLDVGDTTALIVTDHNNKCIKSFYTRNNQKHHSKLNLSSNPHSMTILGKCKVLVLFWYKTDFSVIMANPDLVLHSKIKTSKKYRSVTALSTSTLAAGCFYPPSVDILDMTGTVLKSWTSLTSASCTLEYPWFLSTTNEGNILISDYKAESVYCVTPDGDVQFTYHCTDGVRGITTSSTGHILVVDQKKNTVIQLTRTGEFYRELLMSRDGLDGPYEVCLYGDKLYIAEEDKKVKVYRLQ